MELLSTTYGASEQAHQWGLANRFTVRGYHLCGTRGRARGEQHELLQLNGHWRDHWLPDGVHDDFVACAADSRAQLLGLIVGADHACCGELDRVAIDGFVKRIFGQSAKSMSMDELVMTGKSGVKYSRFASHNELIHALITGLTHSTAPYSEMFSTCDLWRFKRAYWCLISGVANLSFSCHMIRDSYGKARGSIG
jgi:hypothetical protein